MGTYPVTVTEAYEYLDNYNKTELKKMIGNPTSTRGGMSFHQEGDENKGREKTINRQQGTIATTANQETALLQNAKIICRRCGEDGHKSPE